jgi:hypothetical protein
MRELIPTNYSPTAGNTSLLLLAITIIFIIPVLPADLHAILYNFAFIALFIVAVLAMETQRNTMLWIAITACIAELIAYQYDLLYVVAISFGINVVFFIIIVGKMILQIARTKEVTPRVILESINGYLLLGLIYTFFVAFIMAFFPEAYNFSWIGDQDFRQVSHFSDYAYYAFVTFTTLGYGDIVPQIPLTKALAILISTSGQIYIAIIIAMLVGKYASK